MEKEVFERATSLHKRIEVLKSYRESIERYSIHISGTNIDWDKLKEGRVIDRKFECERLKNYFIGSIDAKIQELIKEFEEI